jgi:hypothetical protein
LFIFFPLLQPDLSVAQVEITGFFRNYNAIQMIDDHEYLIGRNRVRLNLSHGFSAGELIISNDIQNQYSAAEDSLFYRLREAYADLFFKNSDLRVGKQILVWGRAEGTFITDFLSPVDLREFITQDFSDLRTGVTALSYTQYFGRDFLQLVANPIFSPNIIPSQDSRWFPEPSISSPFPVNYREYNDTPQLGETQWAGRWGFRSNLKVDLDLGLMYWRHPSPRYFKELTTDAEQRPVLELTEVYTQSLIAMYSGTFRLTDKLMFTSESAFYGRRSFDYFSEALQAIDLRNPSPAEQQQLAIIFNSNQDGFLINRPWLISMIGLRYELFGWTISGQFINEHIFNYTNLILQEQDYSYVTLLLNRSFYRDQFTFRGFTRYNLTGRDFWVNPELIYSGIDAVEASLGMQLFGGTSAPDNFGHFSFSNFANNSFAYLKFTTFF